MKRKGREKSNKKQNNTTWVNECLFNGTITFLHYHQIDIKRDIQEYFNFFHQIKKKRIIAQCVENN